MSVANILGADGKIAASFGGGGGGGLTNPLTSDLLCGGYEVQQASYVRTNIVELETLEPKAPQTFVECVGDFSVAPTKAVDTDTLRVDVMEGRTGSLITALDPLAITNNTTTAMELVYSGPVPGFQDVIFKNTTDAFEGKFSYVHPGGPGQFVLDHSTQIRDPGLTPRIFLIADGASPVTNGQIGYDGIAEQLFMSRSLEVRGQTGAPTTSLRIGNVGNQGSLTYTQATSTLAADKQVQFNGFCPRTAVAPTIGDSLTNKTYVDGVAGFKSTYMFYVSKQGNDTTGTGSATKPFLTIQKAITTVEALPLLDAVNQAVIVVDAGQYSETLSFTKGYTSIIGSDYNIANGGGPVQLSGAVVVNLTGANDLFNKQVSFANFNITGNISDNSLIEHTFALNNCNIFLALTNRISIGSGVNARAYINNCFINHTGSLSPIVILSGQLYMTNCQVSTVSNVRLLDIDAVATASRVQFNNFENSNATLTLGPIVSITSSSALPHTFAGNSFTYTSPAVKTGSPNSSGILFDGGASNQIVVAVNNVFSLNGTANPSNHAIMKNATMAGVATCIQIGNNALLGAYRVEAAIVQPPTVNPVS